MLYGEMDTRSVLPPMTCLKPRLTTLGHGVEATVSYRVKRDPCKEALAPQLQPY